VIHLAAKKAVGESVTDPLRYYRENVSGLITLLEAAKDCSVQAFVYSSSAAVYGNPDVDLVDESVPCRPLSPYGETKLIGEQLLAAAHRAYGLRHASLRYFNVAGAATPTLADRGGSNVVPAVFARLSAGHAPQIFGDDYPTPDGTCLRDYIDVRDVASAHVSAARYLLTADGGAGGPEVFNLGRGEGTSVRELITAVQHATGITQPSAEVIARRPGDPARCVASTVRAETVLGWKAGFGLTDMITTSWDGWRVEHGISLHPSDD
jgi:UDP-glucose 4-epimerase